MNYKQLKQQRKALGMTQVELANALGFHPIHISKLENGVHKISRQTELAIIAMVKDRMETM